ncbi:MAG: dipeptide epimerase [Gemmatimonadota bacterium]
MLNLDYDVLELQTRHEFHIARAAAPPARRNVWVRLAHDDIQGWGEAAPNAFYAESADTVVEALEGYRSIVESGLGGPGGPCDKGDLNRLELGLLQHLPSRHPKYPPHPSARSAISAALLDLQAKLAQQPLWQYLGLQNVAPLSSFTIGIDEPQVMREKAAEAASYSILKVKVGTDRDEETLKLLREAAPNARIRVDANTGWSAEQAIALLPMLRDYQVELIEQPVPADDYEGLAKITSASEIPIIADESCRVSADVEKLKGKVHGVNIKLAKCGSVVEAIRIAEAARALGMRVMLGCMVETTLGIATAIQIASLADYVDLDGAALLANDPFRGPHIDTSGAVHFNDDPGLCVTGG